MEKQMDKYNLHRFIEAQDKGDIYSLAINELSEGKKHGHWLWFIFPQLKGLGQSHASNFYGISCLDEAKA